MEMEMEMGMEMQMQMQMEGTNTPPAYHSHYSQWCTLSCRALGPQWNQTWGEMVLPFGGMNLTFWGYSKASRGSGFYVKEPRFLVDCGAVEGTLYPQAVFVTHCHLDHVKEAPTLIKYSPTTFFVPKPSLPHFTSFMTASLQMASGGEGQLPPYTALGVQPGDSKRIPPSVTNSYNVKVIKTSHTLPSVGYCFSFNVQPLFAYLGDTTEQVFTDSPELFDYPFIFVECTYLENSPKMEEMAQEYQHTMWPRLREIVLAHPSNTFILTHFSMRYPSYQLSSFFSQVPNVVPWVPLYL
ncbi:MBL fold metallo-hydrolase [Pelomyxa schiedti]|nr:MBL fold metallo-hydrolase [Pelomyxa schiedti]